MTLSISGDEGSSTTTGTVMVIGGSTGQGSSVKAQFTASPIAGRAPLEAASIGIDLEADDVAFRCNLVTLKYNREKSRAMPNIRAAMMLKAKP